VSSDRSLGMYGCIGIGMDSIFDVLVLRANSCLQKNKIMKKRKIPLKWLGFFLFGGKRLDFYSVFFFHFFIQYTYCLELEFMLKNIFHKAHAKKKVREWKTKTKKRNRVIKGKEKTNSRKN
jgi:hypothetical protein